MEQQDHVSVVLILGFSTAAQLLIKGRKGGVSPGVPPILLEVICTPVQSSACSHWGGPTAHFSPNLPVVQPSLHFIQTLKTEMYEEK